jgi:Protein of unknown function (DUF3618)
MARSPAEIQADIALTRRVIERQLDALSRRVPNTRWMPWLVGAGALGAGFLLSRVPFLRAVGLSARAVQTAIAVAGTVAAVDRFLATRQPPTA